MECSCNQCGYRFEAESVKAQCPYCGKSGTIAADKNAEELVDELV